MISFGGEAGEMPTLRLADHSAKDWPAKEQTGLKYFVGSTLL
jgi:hypothetical protein